MTATTQLDGELIETPRNTLRQNRVRDRLVARLLPLVEASKLGSIIAEQAYDFGSVTHSPDVSFFGSAKQPLADPNKRIQHFVPDLAIDIISDDDTVEAVLCRKNRYRQCATAEVWILLPMVEEILVYSADGVRVLTSQDQLTSDRLPGFSTVVSEIFQEPW